MGSIAIVHRRRLSIVRFDLTIPIRNFISRLNLLASFIIPSARRTRRTIDRPWSFEETITRLEIAIEERCTKNFGGQRDGRYVRRFDAPSIARKRTRLEDDFPSFFFLSTPRSLSLSLFFSFHLFLILRFTNKGARRKPRVVVGTSARKNDRSARDDDH